MTSVESPTESLATLRERAYKHRAPKEALRHEQTKGYLVSKIEVNNGIFVHYDGMEFPERSPAPAEDLFFANYSKRMFIASLKLIAKNPIYLILVLLMPYRWKIKKLNQFLDYYVDTNIGLIRTVFLKEEHLAPLAQELQKTTFYFLTDLGVVPKIADQFAEILANLINLDNAYRYRLHDLLRETRPRTLLERPIREIWRLLKLNREREEHRAVSVKFKLVVVLLTIALLHPRVRRAFKRTILTSEFKKFYPQPMDKFWMNVRTGYKFFGKTDQERKRDINHLKVCKPITIK